MGWFRMDDRLPLSVKVHGLADPSARGDKAITQRNEALGQWVLAMTWVAGERTDGFIPAGVLEGYGTKASTARLLEPRFGRAPLVHQLGPDGTPPDCKCLEGRAWPPGFAYCMHDYLDRNPSRSESDVHRTKARELRDPALKHAVAERDEGCCRYCGIVTNPLDRRSDAGRTFDHVDPLIADGAVNLVVACRGCNQRKGKRTPEQAGMVLRPLGGPVLRPVPDQGSATVTETVLDPDPERDLDQDPERDSEPRTELGAELGPDPEPAQTSRSTGRDGAGPVIETAPRGVLTTYKPSHHAGVPPAETPITVQELELRIEAASTVEQVEELRLAVIQRGGGDVLALAGRFRRRIRELEAALAASFDMNGGTQQSLLAAGAEDITTGGSSDD